MKKFTLILTVLIISLLFTTSAFSTGGVLINDPIRTKAKETTKVIFLKSGKGEFRFVPSKGIEGYISIDGKTLEMEIPFRNFPIMVSIEDTETLRNWTGIFTDLKNCVVGFDGSIGDYRITLTDSEDNTYVAFFSIL